MKNRREGNHTKPSEKNRFLPLLSSDVARVNGAAVHKGILHSCLGWEFLLKIIKINHKPSWKAFCSQNNILKGVKTRVFFQIQSEPSFLGYKAPSWGHQWLQRSQQRRSPSLPSIPLLETRHFLRAVNFIPMFHPSTRRLLFHFGFGSQVLKRCRCICSKGSRSLGFCHALRGCVLVWVK